LKKIIKLGMLFSKSFGYALRGVLYIALMQDEKKWIQVDEVAGRLGVPRYFMGKIMKRLAKEQLLVSSKGPYGGFTLHEDTLSKPLYAVVEIIDGLSSFQCCVLRMQECNAENPCPMHTQIEDIKSSLKTVLVTTNIGDLLKTDKQEFIKSIATKPVENLILNPQT
jgi:Rrf2 family transcriptional regulator, iron-sulfur cluster assembly transcription factor